MVADIGKVGICLDICSANNIQGRRIDLCGTPQIND
jgi:hypothetical protein